MKIVDIEGDVVYVEKVLSYINEEEWHTDIKSGLGLPPQARLQVALMNDESKKLYRVEKISSRKQPSSSSSHSSDLSVEESLRRENELLKAQIRKLGGLELDNVAKAVVSKPPPAAATAVFPTHDACINQKMLNVQMVDIFSGQAVSMQSLFQHSLVVLDFWSTTCPNCPAAVDVLQTYAQKYQSDKKHVHFGIINTNSLELAKPFINSKSWKYGQHLFVTLEIKEQLKKFLGMKTLPHHVMIKDGVVIGNGKVFDWKRLDDEVKKIPLPPQDTCLNTEMMDAQMIDIATEKEVSVHDIISKNKVVVFDFWSTTCPNCPAAVDVLQSYAQTYEDRNDVAFCIINTNSLELAKPFIASRNWSRGQHYHVTLDVKESFKRFLGMKTLPYHVMISDRKVVGNGRFFYWKKLEEIFPKQEKKTSSVLSEINPNTTTVVQQQPQAITKVIQEKPSPTAAGPPSSLVFTLDEDF